jgi:hypothetical protein
MCMGHQFCFRRGGLFPCVILKVKMRELEKMLKHEAYCPFLSTCMNYNILVDSLFSMWWMILFSHVITSEGTQLHCWSYNLMNANFNVFYLYPPSVASYKIKCINFIEVVLRGKRLVDLFSAEGFFLHVGFHRRSIFFSICSF